VLDELRHQEAIATRLARKQLRRTRFLP